MKRGLAACALAAALTPPPIGAAIVDFEGAAVGAVPPRWSVAMTSTGGAPRWEIVRDSSSPAGANVLAQLSDDDTSGRFPLAVFADAETTDGSVAVRFKPISGRVDQAAGLVWRYRDQDNYYIVRANALENNVVLYKVQGGRRVPLAPLGRGTDYGVEHTVPAQRWSELRVAFEGSRFTVFFDGERLFDVVDDSFAGAGKVGLWTKADSVIHFDAFEIVAR